MKKLKDNRVLILGGSSDIAKDLIIHFIKKNYIVDAHFNNNSKKLKELEIKYKESLNLIKLDFSKCNNKNYKNKIIKNFNNHYNIYINLVGYIDNKNFENNTLKNIETSLNINFLIPFFILQHIIKKMLKKKFGRILNVSSIGVKFGGAVNNLNYSLSKHNLEFIPAIYKKWSKSNVFINCIRLGVFNTKIHNKIKNKNLKNRVSLIPIERLGEPSEVIGLMDYLTSKENSYMTGEIINFAGGE